MANTTFSGPVRSENGFQQVCQKRTTRYQCHQNTTPDYDVSMQPQRKGPIVHPMLGALSVLAL